MKTALITGGNRGIGKAIAKGLIAQGCNVVVASRNLEDAENTARELNCASVRIDLEEPDGFAEAVASVGGVDILVNNAGVLFEGSILYNREKFDRSMQIMCTGPLELIRVCLPGMQANKWGRIVNLSSDWGSFAQGLGGPGAYGVAKAAMNAVTKALPRDLPEGVKINAVSPGWVRTRMGGEAASRSPEEGADTAIWLATLEDDGPTGGFFQDREPFEW